MRQPLWCVRNSAENPTSGPMTDIKKYRHYSDRRRDEILLATPPMDRKDSKNLLPLIIPAISGMRQHRHSFRRPVDKQPTFVQFAPVDGKKPSSVRRTDALETSPHERFGGSRETGVFQKWNAPVDRILIHTLERCRHGFNEQLLRSFS
ncbi:hypothetical protein FRB94_004081 [Tulasnella sp. JGI-2019a]|nr:hypothetical protein FRB94_004081 [Tulasnella sp. JGI-2019a]KAG9013356.1 hypothetical protein FRB93_000879 [Tulasnella sp. JGI-2019a]KAG9026887.1 hypothetical protein FRB95_008340 [Tulasnella sp. JGI-2019a]